MIEYKILDRRGILEITDAVHSIIEKYHGGNAARDTRLHIDYLAVLMLALIDMGNRGETKEVRSQSFSLIMRNVQHMAMICEKGGIPALMNSQC